jgi:hypothetical protein
VELNRVDTTPQLYQVRLVAAPKREEAAPACDTPTSKGLPQLTYESRYPPTGWIIA